MNQAQSYRVEFPDSITAAMWMLKAILESIQMDREILRRPWNSTSYDYRGNASDNGITQRYVKFTVVFRDDFRRRHTVSASGAVYRNGKDEWYRGEFEVALWGTSLPKTYQCKLVHDGQYEIREGTLA